MKFIKLQSKHTEIELKKILSECSEYEVEFIEDVYAKLDYVEFINKDGFVGMFFSTSDSLSKKLIDFYLDKSIRFSFDDISREALFGNEIDTTGYKLLLDPEKDAKSKIDELISKFYKSNIDVDTILDKINEKGIESLSEVDKNLLK